MGPCSLALRKTQASFFVSKYTVFLAVILFLKNDFEFGDFLLSLQPRTELGGITEPFIRENEDRRTGACAWDAQDQNSQMY